MGGEERMYEISKINEQVRLECDYVITEFRALEREGWGVARNTRQNPTTLMSVS
jgi:hypothetical protein